MRDRKLTVDEFVEQMLQFSDRLCAAASEHIRGDHDHQTIAKALISVSAAICDQFGADEEDVPE